MTLARNLVEGQARPATFFDLERFWAMLAHYHGQIWNASEFARAFGVSHHVIRRYLDTLQATFMVRVLRPWTANLKKRQVKAPKVYIRDRGVLHNFLEIESIRDLESHPKIGASWEGFILEAVLQRLDTKPAQCYFWATHTGAELDLLVVHGRHHHGFEIKRTTALGVTPSMRSAMEHLQLTRVDVVHAGSDTYPLGGNIRAVAAERCLTGAICFPNAGLSFSWFDDAIYRNHDNCSPECAWVPGATQ